MVKIYCREKSESSLKTQIQRLGRQKLEALLFLKERVFPSCSHLNSGNIIIQTGVARLSGLENVLSGFTSRIYPVISKSFRSDSTVIDVICFGHVLFEMCAGYELTVDTPTAANLLDIYNYPQKLWGTEKPGAHVYGLEPSEQKFHLGHRSLFKVKKHNGTLLDVKYKKILNL